MPVSHKAKMDVSHVGKAVAQLLKWNSSRHDGRHKLYLPKSAIHKKSNTSNYTEESEVNPLWKTRQKSENVSGRDFGKPKKLKRPLLNPPVPKSPNSKEEMAIVKKQCLPVNELSSGDVKRQMSCHSETALYMKKQMSVFGNRMSLPKCSCHLKKDRAKHMHKRVALVSLPGSGNTWVRGLLERATNICTGAMWCDPNLRATQFCGEGLHGAQVLVVKNHDPTIRWRGEVLPKSPGISENNKPPFDAAIFVHRDPYAAMVAEHNREVGYEGFEAGNVRLNLSLGHHVQSFGEKHFGDNVKWNHRVKQLVKIWESMINHLLIGENKNRPPPVLLIKFEDLIKNTTHEVLRMVRFLGHDMSEGMLRDRLKQDFSTFKRNDTIATFEHFTAAQKQLINTVISYVGSRLKPQLLPVKEYIRK